MRTNIYLIPSQEPFVTMAQRWHALGFFYCINTARSVEAGAEGESMSKLYFGNAGDFDVRAMLTFGVSAKDNENAIGYFGTGFKYAVAIILRLGGKIVIRTNGQDYEFTSNRETIRGKEFDVIKVNGVDANFTTRLGINWQPWQAFRELYCNCKDELGEISSSPISFDTVVEVDCIEVYKAWLDKDRFILSGEPDLVGESADIRIRPSEYIFYRGIAVQSTHKPAMLTYSVNDHLDLTEDRTARSEYYATYAIQKALQAVSEPETMYRVLTASKDTYEGNVQFDPSYPTSECFLETASRLLNSGKSVHDSVLKVLAKHDAKKGNFPEVALTGVQQQMLDRALSFLSKMDIPPTQFPIKIVSGLGDGVMGRALNGTIYLSALPFNMGTKQVASTLMEEWVHCRHGVADFDRNMKSWLFDKILSLGEEINGAPL